MKGIYICRFCSRKAAGGIPAISLKVSEKKLREPKPSLSQMS